MARRSDHNNQELRELAITNSLKLIAKNGNDAFKARDIAREMGYTVGTIYYLFGSMNDLRYHVAGRMLDDFYQVIENELGKKKNRLNYHITKYVHLVTEHPNFSSFLYAQKLSPQKAPDWYMQKYKRHFSLFADTIHSSVGNKARAQKAAKYLWIYIHGICTLYVQGKLPFLGETRPENMVKHLANTYLDGLSR